MKEIFRNKDAFKVFHLFDPNFKPGGMLKGDKFLAFVEETMQAQSFDELQIQFKAVATDFWRREAVVFDSGDLLTAIRASMAIPYLFTPIVEDDRVLVDGGLVNNLPYNLLPPECDITIAVDISGDVTTPRNKIPSPMDAMFFTYQVMMDAMSNQKIQRIPPDIHVRAPIQDVEILDFHKAQEIYEQGLASKDDFREKLTALLERRGGIEWFKRQIRKL